MDQLRRYHRGGIAGWEKVKKSVHLFDLDPKKIEDLEGAITSEGWEVDGIDTDIRCLEFSAALEAYDEILKNPRAAKLLIIDQFGVDAVNDDVFAKLISYPRTDFIFFLSTSTLHRFRDHPAIKQKIPHPEDSYHVHRAAYEYFHSLIPTGTEVFLGQFSIKKRSNIYGLIFGSQHPLGIHKFLEVTWKNDRIAGEADFDVNREGIGESELLFEFEEMKPRKIHTFESDLREAFRAKRFRNEAEIARFCIEAGMTCQHARPIITQLKREGLLDCSFHVPNVRALKNPRPVAYR